VAVEEHQPEVFHSSVDLRCLNASRTARLRITRLRENENLGEVACAMLKHLGEFKRPYLANLKEKLLSLIEKQYGIIDEIARDF
jgi:hypothetical protein